jgi:uncharacterized protein YggT (Ycf19 family)
MAQDQRVAIDEVNRLTRHEEIKDEINRDIKSQIQKGAKEPSLNAEEASRLGEKLQHDVIDELSHTEAELKRGRVTARVAQVIDFAFFLIYGIISLEILLDLIGARDTNSFRVFVHSVATPLLAPFKALVPDPSAGRFQLRISFLIALIVYVLLHIAIGRLLKLAGSRVQE